MSADGRVAWFHCFSGIAGDMALGSLVDAGADTDELLRLLERLPLRGYSIDFEPVLRGGIAATRAVVTAADDGVVRTFPHILAIIEEARLPARARARAIAVFSALARVEGRLHRRPMEQVHFHEVGGQDAIVDIVGTACALEILDIDVVTASAVAMGIGVVRTEHGLLPNPPPAVLGLLSGVPTYGREVNVELTTPTGAAILAATATSFGVLPPMTLEAVGYGAGGRDLDDLPNCVQVVLGVGRSVTSGHELGQPVLLLETNLDDVSGEVLAHAVERLLAAGAHDAWIVPVLMKKGRPGQVLSVLADPALGEAMRRVIEQETGTLGVRATRLERWPRAREFASVEVDGALVDVKVSPGRVKVEQAAAARAARQLGLPLREVMSRAEEAWRTGRGRGPEDPAG